MISTYAGTGTASYSGDGGQASSAKVYSPTGIDVDSSGNVYISDWGNNRVRKVTASTGIINTYAGTGSASFSGDGGVATSATLYHPEGLCIDSSGNSASKLVHRSTHLLTGFTRLLGNVYIADSDNHRIRKITASTTVITTFAGTGTGSYSGDNGVASSAKLNHPFGVALDSSGKRK